MAELNYSYGINEVDSMKALIADTAKAWSIVSGGGIDSVTIVGGDGKASIQGSTLYIDTGDNFDSSTFITRASVTGAQASIQNNTLFIEVPTIDTSTFISKATINSGTVTISGNTLGIDIPTDTTVSGVTDVSVVGGDILASIKSDTLYLLTADSTPKSGAGLTLSPNPVTLTSTGATLTASHAGDGVLSVLGLPAHVTASLIGANQIAFSGWNEGNAGILLSETADYYAAAQNVQIVTSGYKTLYDMPLTSDFTNYGSATVTPIGSYSFDPQYGLAVLGSSEQRSFGFSNFGGALTPFILEFDVYKVAFDLLMGTGNVVDCSTSQLFNYANNQYVDFDEQMQFDQWYNFKLVSNPFSSVKCYIDDVLVAETSAPVANPISSFTFSTSAYFKNFKYQEAV